MQEKSLGVDFIKRISINGEIINNSDYLEEEKEKQPT